jgi:transcriptional regulator with XRE-family HTH domain
MNRRQAGSNAEPTVRAVIGHVFGQTVRSLRLEAGISQERLALGAGINRAHLAGLERGLHTPTLYTVCRLLPGLHVTFVEFCRTFERNLSKTHLPASRGRTTPLTRTVTQGGIAAGRKPWP